MKDITISIFTPTYNRAYIIERLYESLLKQKNKKFEWIVIDDGSEDGTSKLFEKIVKNTTEFEVVYKYKLNGGKHKAINEGVKLARGKYFFIVDSDDFLTEDAIEKINNWCKQIEDKVNFAGVAGLRGYSKDKVNGGFPKKYIDIGYVDATNLERSRYSLLEDKAEIYKTEILKKYPFPDFAGEKFLPEAIVWDSIANDGYKIRWFNEIIYIGNYLTDGLTKGNNLIQSSFNGYREFVYREINFKQPFLNKIKYIAILARESVRNDIECREIQIKNLNTFFYIIYWIIYKLYFHLMRKR